ncbi:DNA-3-methyladenine glycosylase I [Neptuniibacter sp. CAU 1671]|uniref:DNA-3-methyladenine glycosylase I n=1 Tax=Neptuniibacter sp. CAU 1671 TaxID=3032593 RepID=UPI0023DB676A|nr:DNA-3-methyladenine glycosylase I [Neptuniibacter sp. CAU 1671]MDF2182762.1 DNA-3-methyladenine glycosylase I [Neptuniibacter sp. CAU 1671]
MKKFEWIYQHVSDRLGAAATEVMLPQSLSDAELAEQPDDRLLSAMSRRVFRAGIKHSVVDAKWPAFEQAFFGFVPEKVSLMSDDQLEQLMQNAEIIRHFGKIKATRANAMMVHELAERYGSFATWLAQWPASDIVGLWKYLQKEGSQLGGNSGAYFLRMVGKDTFILTDDVVAALKAQGIVEKRPTAKADLQRVQDAFNEWQAQSGRPLCQISRLLACTVG